jgi:hypothetical protein
LRRAPSALLGQTRFPKHAVRAFSNVTRPTAAKSTAVIVAAAVLMVGPSACGSDSSSHSNGSGSTVAKKAGAECTPAVMVVRHAEDESNPSGGADILSKVGNTHAGLYPKLFRDYLAKTHGVGPGGAAVSVCPIGKIIAINNEPNPQNTSPGSNPYNTIKPLADALGLTVQTKDAAGVSYSTVYNWDTARRKTLLNDGSTTPTSTVIAWDKQGLNPSADDLSGKTINGKTLADYGFVPLLKALPTNEAAIVGSGDYYTPQRTDFYVFSLQDPDSGKFAFAKAYQQSFSDDGGSTWYYRTALSPTDQPNDIKT